MLLSTSMIWFGNLRAVLSDVSHNQNLNWHQALDTLVKAPSLIFNFHRHIAYIALRNQVLSIISFVNALRFILWNLIIALILMTLINGWSFGIEIVVDMDFIMVLLFITDWVKVTRTILMIHLSVLFLISVLDLVYMVILI